MKMIFQILIGLFEFIGIPFLFADISRSFSPIDFSNGNIWGWLERISFCFVFYEVIVVGIRKLQIDAKKDALLALKTSYDIAELFIVENDLAIKTYLFEMVEKQMANNMLNPMNVISEYNILKESVEKRNINVVRLRRILVSHAYESVNLLWEYTLLLRMLK